MSPPRRGSRPKRGSVMKLPEVKALEKALKELILKLDPKDQRRVVALGRVVRTVEMALDAIEPAKPKKAPKKPKKPVKAKKAPKAKKPKK